MANTISDSALYAAITETATDVAGGIATTNSLDDLRKYTNFVADKLRTFQLNTNSLEDNVLHLDGEDQMNGVLKLNCSPSSTTTGSGIQFTGSSSTSHIMPEDGQGKVLYFLLDKAGENQKTAAIHHHGLSLAGTTLTTTSIRKAFAQLHIFGNGTSDNLTTNKGSGARIILEDETKSSGNKNRRIVQQYQNGSYLFQTSSDSPSADGITKLGRNFQTHYKFLTDTNGGDKHRFGINNTYRLNIDSNATMVNTTNNTLIRSKGMGKSAAQQRFIVDGQGFISQTLNIAANRTNTVGNALQLGGHLVMYPNKFTGNTFDQVNYDSPADTSSGVWRSIINLSQKDSPNSSSNPHNDPAYIIHEVNPTDSSTLHIISSDNAGVGTDRVLFHGGQKITRGQSHVEIANNGRVSAKSFRQFNASPNNITASISQSGVGTFSSIVSSGNANVGSLLLDSVTVTGIVTSSEGIASVASDSKLVTEKAMKAYVDAEVITTITMSMDIRGLNKTGSQATSDSIANKLQKITISHLTNSQRTAQIGRLAYVHGTSQNLGGTIGRLTSTRIGGIGHTVRSTSNVLTNPSISNPTRTEQIKFEIISDGSLGGVWSYVSG
jgi:hypothetical protein